VKGDSPICSKQDCTFALTGTCLEAINNPTTECPHLKLGQTVSPQAAKSNATDVIDESAESSRQFHSGLELGVQDVARLMRARYTKLVGVLGQVEAGKTCLFTSMYLQLTGRRLCPNYRFIASDTLLGFEQRARHLRDWTKGGVQEQIVDHTQLGHSRSPAFLHLAFQDSIGLRHDLLLPDLPGEWTSRLLSEASTASRFAFLSRSDVVLLVFEASRFANPRSRNNAVTDAAHMLGRLAVDVRLPTTVPIVLAVTKCDETDGKVPAEMDRVAAIASDHGYAVQTVPLAVFPSSASTIPIGFGIDTLLTHLTSQPDGSIVPGGSQVDGADRSYLKARGHR
jgi:hypothetical protein